MSIAVGIDLGTTNSAIARLDEHGRPVIIPNHLGEAVTPSVICFKNAETIIGHEAKELQAAGEPLVAAFFKREMGERDFVFHANGRDYSATELSAMVLEKIKRDAEQSLSQSITDAVITVPAYFHDLERAATIAAGRQAGLNVLQVINEPTAAAIAYGYKRTTKEQMLLVYDLGGGTFDVTLLRIDGEEIRILDSEGDHELGGKNWDDRIVEFLATRFRDEFGSDPFEDSISLSDLLVRAEEAKKRLSSSTSTKILIVHDGNQGRYELDRDTFERITYDLMERAVSLTRKALGDQQITESDVDGVLLVGGSTRMPMVHEFIKKTFGRPPMMGVNVDEAVALGAAIVASERVGSASASGSKFALGGRRTIDVTNHSLGMIALNENRSAFINSVILPKNTAIPCIQIRPYQHRTRRRGANRLEIFMTQGESSSPADVRYLGMHVLHDVPYQEGGTTVIDVQYAYDISGTVEVKGRLRSHGSALKMTVEPLPPDVPERFLRVPEETVEAQHVTAYLAFDLSGSMSGAPLMEAQKAARSFLHNTDLSHCSVGIIAVADSTITTLNASQNARKIERAIDELPNVHVGYGNSADPFDEVRLRLSDVEGPRFAIVLADGVWSYQEKAIKRAEACHQEGIEVIAIGFGSADKEFLRKIASSDEASFFTSMNGLVETFANIAQVLTESGGGTSTTDNQGKRKSLLSFVRGK
jgi:molecular chaperone DnaK (HSP70)